MSQLIKIQSSESTILYIPKDLIDSFSLSDTSIRINFTREVKITGFKKSDHIKISINWDDKIRAKIIQKIENELIRAFN